MDKKPIVMQNVIIHFETDDEFDVYLYEGQVSHDGIALDSVIVHRTDRFCTPENGTIVLDAYYSKDLWETDLKKLIILARYDHEINNDEGFIWYSPVIKDDRWLKTTIFKPLGRILINIDHIRYVKYEGSVLLMNDDQLAEFLTADMEK